MHSTIPIIGSVVQYASVSFVRTAHQKSLSVAHIACVLRTVIQNKEDKVFYLSMKY